MTWVKLSDDFATHPKVIGLSDAALRALIESYCYAARHRTDGHVPAPVLKRIAPRRTKTELVDAGLWDTNGDGGTVIHDYLEYNPSRAELDEKDARISEVRREAGRIGGLRSGEARRNGSKP